MADSQSVRGADRPPAKPPLRVDRPGPIAPLLLALRSTGFALLKGPAGAGTSWLAMDVATRWPGPVVWTRPGLFWHLGDLAERLWAGTPPRALQGGSAEQMVQAVLSKLEGDDILWVLDDADVALAAPPAVAHPRDPDLAVLLAALDAGELADTSGAVLLVSRRVPAGCSPVLHPLPPLSPEDIAALTRRDVHTIDPAYGARPAALPLIAALPPDHPLPDPEHPFAELVEAVASTRLDTPAREVLLGLASSSAPVSPEALTAATGIEPDDARPALLRLLNCGLARHRGGGWWMPRVLSSAARDVLPDLLPGVMPRAALQRLAGWNLRLGVGAGTDWESIAPARPTRLGLRMWAQAGDGVMAMQTVRFGHYTSVLRRLGAWRALRDDLGVALSTRLADVGPGDIAWARHQRALAAWKLGDHATAEQEITRALPDAKRAGEPELLCEVHSTLARRVLLAGEPDQARPHIRAALSIAHAHGDTARECDLENQRGAVALQLGHWDDAATAFTRSKELATELGDERKVAARSAALGGVAMYRGQLREAETRLAEAVAAARAQGDGSGLLHRLANLALVRSQRQDFPGALSAVGQALAGGAGLDARSAARLLSLRANLRRLAGDMDGAATDLNQASELAARANDREGAAQVAFAQGHWLCTAGRFSDAIEACEAALEMLPSSREEALRATWRIQLHNAQAWGAAERTVAGTGDGIADLLEASALAKEALALVPEEPLTARRLGAFQQASECELLAATTTGTVPMGLMRRLEGVWAAAAAHPERIDSGEPALRLNLAWAIRLCGQRERAASEARRAGMDAGRCGLATVRGRSLAVRKAQGIPAWNRQAVLLEALLS